MLCESGSPSVIDMFQGLGWVFNDNEIYCPKAIEYQNADNLEFLLKNQVFKRQDISRFFKLARVVNYSNGSQLSVR